MFGSFENEALQNEDRSTKYPNLENEVPKSRKRSTQKLENKDPKNSKTKTPKLETGQFWSLHKHVCVPKKKMHIKIRCIKHSETNNKINTGYPI